MRNNWSYESRPRGPLLSYNRDQAGFAKLICEQCRNQGYTPWIDTEALLPGSEFERLFQIALREAHSVVAVINRGYLDNQTTQKEMSWILDEENVRGHNLLVPVCIGVTPQDIIDRYPKMQSRLLNNGEVSQQEMITLILRAVASQTQYGSASSTPTETNSPVGNSSGGFWRGARSGLMEPSRELALNRTAIKTFAIIRNGQASYVNEIESSFIEEARRQARSRGFDCLFECRVGDPSHSLSGQAFTLQQINDMSREHGDSLDYIVSIGSGVTRHVLSDVHGKVPIIFAAVTESLDRQFLRELKMAKSQRPISGVTFGVSSSERISFFDRWFPHQRIGLLYNQDFECDTYFAESMSDAYLQMRPSIKLHCFPISSPSDCQQHENSVDLFTGWYYVHRYFNHFTEASSKPFIGAGTLDLRKGAVAAIGNPEDQVGLLAASNIFGESLKGKSLSQIPVERCADQIIGVNLGAAQRASLILPSQLISMAHVRYS